MLRYSHGFYTKTLLKIFLKLQSTDVTKSLCFLNSELLVLWNFELQTNMFDYVILRDVTQVFFMKNSVVESLQCINMDCSKIRWKLLDKCLYHSS